MAAYAATMPKAATTPAPASAPATLAESMLVREMPIAAIRCWAGTVAPTSAVRMPMSDGRTMPARPATHSTASGSSRPMLASSKITAASKA